jgi:ATP-dependent DNA helicase RecQ
MIMLEAHLAAGRLHAAEAEAEGIAGLSGPQSVAPANARGAIALAQGGADAAQEAFREALALRPDNVPALIGLAEALTLAGDMPAADGVLRDALQICTAEARPGLLRRLAALQPEDAQHVAAQLTEALQALADRLRVELQEARAAPRRSTVRRTAAAAAAEHAAPPDSPPAGAALLAHTRGGADELPPEHLAQALFQHFGHTSFRSGQAAVLRTVLSEGKDTLALMPTGAGKSLCFQLPSVLLPGTVVVISPLIALMADQIAGLADVQALAGRATVINSTLSAEELESRLQEVAAGVYSLVYAAPERLRQAPMQRALQRAGVSLLVIDEAHCLCLWGHAFRPDYLAIGELAEALGSPRILAVTATATPTMQAEIAQTLDRRLTVVNTGVLRDNLFLEVRALASESEKRNALLDFVRAVRGPGIVYAGSRERCEKLSVMLRKFGQQAAYYHAGLPAAEREAVQQDFMAGRVRVLVATIAFGMGVNKRDIRFIVHFQPSRSLEAYTQEVGRAGRDGQPAHCLLLAIPADKGTLTRRAHEDRLDVPALRDLYARVRHAMREMQGAPIDLAALCAPEDDRRQAEVAVRVGLSVLERAGFIHRGLDTPREMSLLLKSEPQDARLRVLAAAFGLQPWRQQTLRTIDIATTLQVAPDLVEGLLADLRDQGVLDLAVARRGLVLRLVDPPPAEGAERLAAILSAIDQAAESRARALVRYIESAKCRNAVIARHFGLPTDTTCDRCDNCQPGGRRTREQEIRKPSPARLPTMPPRLAILQLVDELPFAAGRRGLSRILAGASSSPIGPDRCRLHGALAGMSQAAIAAQVDALLEAGLLQALDIDVDSDRGQRLRLTERGRHELEAARETSPV